MRAKKKDKRLSLTLHDIEFKVFEEEGTGARKGGRMQCHVRRHLDSAVVKDYDINFTVLSLWQLPHIRTAVKAHLVLDLRNGLHLQFRADLQQLGEVKVGVGETGMGGVEYSMMLDQRVLRYGQSSGKKGHIQYLDSSTGKAARIYESKAKAFLDIIDHMRINRAIGGHQKVNFAGMSDEILEGVGFTKMPDILGFGVSMWSGSPASLVSQDDGWDRVAKEKSIANTESLLSIIQQTIGA